MHSKINDRISYVGVNDLRGRVFEGQWPLPHGVSYNSYLVVDDKVALIDTAAAGFSDEFFFNIKAEIGDRPVDYLIVNHMEPDHSALMAPVRQKWPDIRIVTNAKAAAMIKEFNGIDTGIILVKEGDTLSLGHCSLSFHMVPMVHWPETMVTWIDEQKTVFSGDAFGCFGAVCGDIRDYQSSLYKASSPSTDTFEAFKSEMQRYYADIVGKYGAPVQAALRKLSGLDIQRICPTHGPVWEKYIPQVVSLYDRLSRYDADHGVNIVYGSMYGNTAAAAQALSEALDARGIPNEVHDLVAEQGPSFAYAGTFRYDTLAVGSPTYNTDIFPAVRDFMHGVALRGVKGRRFAAFGSYTWVGGGNKVLNTLAAEARMEVLCEGYGFKSGYDPSKFDAAAFADLLANG